MYTSFSLFVSFQESRFAYMKNHANTPVPDRTPEASPDDSKNTIVYRLSQRNGIEIKVTPLLISVLEALQSDHVLEVRTSLLNRCLFSEIMSIALQC